MAEEDMGPRWPATVALVAVIAAPALLLFAWSRPMAAAPMEMPPLVLAPSEVTEARDAMAALTERADRRGRRHATRAVSRGEHRRARGQRLPGQAQLRRGRLTAALNALVEANGEDTIAATRAADVERGMRALGGNATPEEAVSEVGAFLRMMERYSMASSGTQTAPDFVVRTALMARWNAVHDRELTEGFLPVHLRAYWGWLALHAASAPIELRQSALDHYEEAGGTRADEARGAIAYEEGDLAAAHVAFERAHQRRGGFRLRNLMLGALEDPGSN